MFRLSEGSAGTPALTSTLTLGEVHTHAKPQPLHLQTGIITVGYQRPVEGDEVAVLAVPLAPAQASHQAALERHFCTVVTNAGSGARWTSSSLGLPFCGMAVHS